MKFTLTSVVFLFLTITPETREWNKAFNKDDLVCRDHQIVLSWYALTFALLFSASIANIELKSLIARSYNCVALYARPRRKNPEVINISPGLHDKRFGCGTLKLEHADIWSSARHSWTWTRGHMKFGTAILNLNTRTYEVRHGTLKLEHADIKNSARHS